MPLLSCGRESGEAEVVTELGARVLPVHVNRAAGQRLADLLVRGTERVGDLEAVRVEHVCRHLRHQLLLGEILAADGQLRAIAAGLASRLGTSQSCRRCLSHVPPPELPPPHAARVPGIASAMTASSLLRLMDVFLRML